MESNSHLKQIQITTHNAVKSCRLCKVSFTVKVESFVFVLLFNHKYVASLEDEKSKVLEDKISILFRKPLALRALLKYAY